MGRENILYRKWVPSIETRISEIHGWLQDIQSTYELASRLSKVLNKEPPDPVLIDALTTAAVVRYTRCFSSGIRARLSIESLTTATPADIDFHEKLQGIRNWHIAHAVNEQEVHAVYLILDGLPGASSAAIGVSSLTRSDIPLDSVEVDDLVKLCGKWIDCLRPQLNSEKAKLAPLASKLTREEILSFPSDEPLPNLNIRAKRKQLKI